MGLFSAFSQIHVTVGFLFFVVSFMQNNLTCSHLLLDSPFHLPSFGKSLIFFLLLHLAIDNPDLFTMCYLHMVLELHTCGF